MLYKDDLTIAFDGEMMQLERLETCIPETCIRCFILLHHFQGGGGFSYHFPLFLLL